MKKRFMFLLFLLLSVLSSCIIQNEPQFSREQYFFLITIDGLRPDYIEKAETTNIDILLEKYNATLHENVQTVCPSITTVAHASLFTGREPTEHKYVDPGDEFFGQTIFQELESKGYKTLFFDGKAGRIAGLENSVSYVYSEKDYKFSGGDLEAMSDFINYVKLNNPDFAFILLPGVDSAGHMYGHESQEYSNAIKVADQAIGLLIEKLNESNLLNKSNIIIVSDHGMTGKDHSSCLPTDVSITLITKGDKLTQNFTSKKITDISEEIRYAFKVKQN